MNSILRRGPLNRTLKEHLKAVTACLLQAYGVKDVARWCPIVVNLAQKAADSISSSLLSSTGSIDPRSHVKVFVPCFPILSPLSPSKYLPVSHRHFKEGFQDRLVQCTEHCLLRAGLSRVFLNLELLSKLLGRMFTKLLCLLKLQLLLSDWMKCPKDYPCLLRQA